MDRVIKLGGSIGLQQRAIGRARIGEQVRANGAGNHRQAAQNRR